MKSSEITNILNTASELKPQDLFIDQLKWKYLLWAGLTGKNILLLGPTRCGKTKAVQSLAKALNKTDKFFYFNMGSTQDARAMLIGNTFYKKETGTFFSQSEFVKAIQIPDSIILLDELTRGHHDAWNIIMPVIDSTQRYLRLDESETSEIVKVAEGVTFAATANIGNEYTATRVLDKAISARFPVKIEMDSLSKVEELSLISVMFPNLSEEHLKTVNKICEIANHTREQVKTEASKVSTFIPTGSVLEMVELVTCGFNLLDIAEVAIYPDFPADGGMESERTYVKQLVQKYMPPKNNKNPVNNQPAPF